MEDDPAEERFGAKALQAHVAKRKFDYSFSSSSSGEKDDNSDEQEVAEEFKGNDESYKSGNAYSDGNESSEDNEIKEALLAQKMPQPGDGGLGNGSVSSNIMMDTEIPIHSKVIAEEEASADE